jgi:transposase-like protein
VFADAARPLRHATGDRWFVDETYVKVAGRWRYLYRAVDQYGQVIDVILAEQRDTPAARRFFTHALGHGPAPVEVTTDQAGPYLRVLDELVPAAAHVTEQYANPGHSSVISSPLVDLGCGGSCGARAGSPGLDLAGFSCSGRRVG